MPHPSEHHWNLRCRDNLGDSTMLYVAVTRDGEVTVEAGPRHPARLTVEQVSEVRQQLLEAQAVALRILGG